MSALGTDCVCGWEVSNTAKHDHDRRLEESRLKGLIAQVENINSDGGNDD